LTLILVSLLAAGACRRPPAEAPSCDLQGRPVDPLRSAAAGRAATVLFFVATSCPISNRYAPELVRLYDRFATRGVSFYLVYPDSDDSPATIREHLRAHGLPLSALRDPGHALVRQGHAVVTPEAALFGPDGRLLYHGRTDDRFVAFGKMRP